MSDLEYIKELLKEYKEVLNCKYPNYMFSNDNYENLDDKDRMILKLLENIIDYLENKEYE